MKYNILLLVTGLDVGGAEKQVIDLADKFSTSGHQVTLIYLGGPILLSPKNSAVNIVGLNIKSSIPSLFAGIVKLFFCVRNIKPDVIHSHMFHSNMISRLIKLYFSNILIVNSAHSSNEGGLGRMFAYRLTNFMCDIFTNVGVDAVKSFESKGAVRKGTMLSVKNGIDMTSYYKDEIKYVSLRKEFEIPENTFVFLLVARLSPEKNILNAIDAMAILNTRRLSIKLLIAGDGELRAIIEKYIYNNGLMHCISLLGRRSDVDDLMRLSDCLILSSDYEGLPLCIGEAMASSLPVISTDCGGPSEFISNFEFLVPIKNPEALATAMTMISDMTTEERINIGVKNHNKIFQEFSLDSIKDKWLTIYSRESL